MERMYTSDSISKVGEQAIVMQNSKIKMENYFRIHFAF